MAIFQYNALTGDGRMMKGTVEATCPEQASVSLNEMGLQVVSVSEAPPESPRSRVGRSELLLFNQQLASITRSGVPLERGLREIAADIEKPSMRKLVTELADDLQAGMSVEDAFSRRKSLFPPLYGYIVKAGVQSGRLSEMLISLNRHLEMQLRTRRIIFEAMTYPLVVLTLAAILLTAIFSYVIPAFKPIFMGMGIDLPVFTRMFLALADNVIPFWTAIGIVGGAVFLILAGMSASPGGRRARESIYFRIPVLGRLYHRGLLSRLADSMAVLIGAGCDLPLAARLAGAATGSQTLMSETDELAIDLEAGKNVVEAGRDCRHIPSMFFYSVQAGYQRNELQDNLYNLSDMYDQQARTNQSRLQGLLMPIMIVFVGGVLAMGIASMFLPMIQLLRTLEP